jgi:hypothetical protein
MLAAVLPQKITLSESIEKYKLLSPVYAECRLAIIFQESDKKVANREVSF